MNSFSILLAMCFVASTPKGSIYYISNILLHMPSILKCIETIVHSEDVEFPIHDAANIHSEIADSVTECKWQNITLYQIMVPQ